MVGIFEELIRKFAESSNETAGEYFTPRDIVHLTTSLVLTGQEEKLKPIALLPCMTQRRALEGLLRRRARSVGQRGCDGLAAWARA